MMDMDQTWKAVFFDIDGTLVDPATGKISERTIQTLKELQEQGILLVAATGRSPDLIPRIPGVRFDACLCFNGSYVAVGDRVVFRHVLKRQDMDQIIRNAASLSLHVCIATEHDVYFSGSDPNLRDYLAFVNMEAKTDPDFEEHLKEPVYQMMAGVTSRQQARLLEGTEEADITAWWDRAADVIPLGSSKGEGLEKLAAALDLKPEEILAFGDGGNDIPMLRKAGTGVAMGNAKEDVKQAADQVCPPVSEDGIWQFFQARTK